LLIVGAGPYKTVLQGQAERLGIAERVEIRSIPASDRQGMAAQLAQADLVTLLSDYEAHPIAVMEALAMQRPVLVTATSGLQELADQGLVRAIPLDSSPQATAEAMMAQLRDPLLPGQVELATWDECVTRLLAVYRAIQEQS
jgi:glycosyltransferase involved in cell wall biosynthesis